MEAAAVGWSWRARRGAGAADTVERVSWGSLVVNEGRTGASGGWVAR